MFVQKTATKTGIKETHLQWKTVSKCLTNCDSDFHSLQRDTPNNINTEEHIRLYFVTCDKEEEIFPLTITEIADAQWADKHLLKIFKRGGENGDEHVTRQYKVSFVIKIDKSSYNKSTNLKSLSLSWY